MSDYEVTWHGGLHKTIPPPPVAPLKPRQPNRPALDRFAQVLAVVTETPQTNAEIATAAGLSVDSATRYLVALWTTGQVDRTLARQPGDTMPMVRYWRLGAAV